MLGQRKVRMGMPWIRVEFGELYWISWVTAFFFGRDTNRDDTRLNMGWRM
jgi:hypothetical protein